MSLEELVSDWELEEIRHELKSGTAPDIVAFRHGVPRVVVLDYDTETASCWADAEKAFVSDNYPNHGADWEGWKILGKTYDVVERYAIRHGIRKRHMRWATEEDALITEHYPEHGPKWEGWRTLMPFRNPSWDSVAHRASALGVRCNIGPYGKKIRQRKEA